MVVGGDAVLPLRRSRLPGAHNAVNVAAAVAVLDALGIDVAGASEPLEEALAAFAPLPHRLEPVRTAAGVTYVDDSLATSAQAAVAACEAYGERPLTLLVGGLDRGHRLRPAGRLPRSPGRKDPAGRRDHGGGGAADRGRPALGPVEAADDVGDAVRLAAKVTPAGGVVLFSPAAASPPEYGTYEQRSAAFVAAVRELRLNGPVRAGPRRRARPSPWRRRSGAPCRRGGGRRPSPPGTRGRRGRRRRSPGSSTRPLPDDVVADDEPAGPGQPHRPVQVLRVGRLVGVDEDEVERLRRSAASAGRVSSAGPTRTSTTSPSPARARFARATSACFGEYSSVTSRPPGASPRASQIVL